MMIFRFWNEDKLKLKTLDAALKVPENISDKEFWSTYCPPLPTNFQPQEDEPEAVQYLLNQRPFLQNARAKYTEKDWRMHRWAYCRLTEIVDKQINQVLTVLKDSNQDENTIIIFTSDHGDLNAAHQLEHKTVFYEEACRVPLIVVNPHNQNKEQTDNINLISNGLDLVPTTCDYAGIEIPADLKGKSFRPLVDEIDNPDWRNYIPLKVKLVI